MTMNRELVHTHRAHTDNVRTQNTIHNRAPMKHTLTHTQMRKKTYDNDNKNIALFNGGRGEGEQDEEYYILKERKCF